MTRWQEVDDLDLDQDFDELDPMAAPVGVFSDGDPEDADDLDVLASEGPWTPEKGFPDGYGVVRLWIDDERRITKVRLSPSWREKLGKTHLSVAFAAAFAFINSHDREGSITPVALAFDQRAADEPFSWDQIDRLARRTQEIAARLDSLGPEAEGKLVGQQAFGESPDKLCAITLELNGYLSSIQFNDRKLNESRVRQVTDAVVKAHAAARANYQPAQYQPGEADHLRSELQGIRNVGLAMMRRGFR